MLKARHCWFSLTFRVLPWLEYSLSLWMSLPIWLPKLKLFIIFYCFFLLSMIIWIYGKGKIHKEINWNKKKQHQCFIICPKDRVFWHHVCKYNWSVVKLSSNSPHSMFPVKPCALLSSHRPQATLASLLYLLELHYVCNPLTASPTSTHRGSLKLLSFCPFPPKSISAICPLLSFMFHLRELKLCLDCY